MYFDNVTVTANDLIKAWFLRAFKRLLCKLSYQLVYFPVMYPS